MVVIDVAGVLLMMVELLSTVSCGLPVYSVSAQSSISTEGCSLSRLTPGVVSLPSLHSLICVHFTEFATLSSWRLGLFILWGVLVDPKSCWQEALERAVHRCLACGCVYPIPNWAQHSTSPDLVKEVII